MNRVITALLPLALCTAGLSYAQAQSPVGSLSADPCGIIDLTSAQRVRVTAHQQVATRLQFPADIVYVVNAAPELWDDSRPRDAGRNLWVRPMTATEAGKTTSISVVTADQRNYEFLMEAASQIPQTSCYDIVDSRAKSETDTELRARQSWEEAQAEFAALQGDREAASQQLSDRQRQLESEFGERAARAEDLAGALTGEFDQLRVDRERLSGAETALRQREETLAALEADRASRIREDDLSRRQIEFQESAAAADRARVEAEARAARQLQEARTREAQLLDIHRERSAQIDSITAARERALQDEISLSVQRNERLRAELAEERARLEELRTRAETATLLAKQSTEEAERNLELRYTAISEQARLQAGDAIEAFKYTVHTAYDWQYSQVPSQIVVDSVYDDGRRTYVRIANDAFGVPAVIGTNRRGSVALNYRYNDLTGVYEIQGLFHSLELRFPDEKIVIERKS